jgi:transcriptional regulator with XRE-family HTH domain
MSIRHPPLNFKRKVHRYLFFNGLYSKSAISRYENSGYKNYSMPLLNKIARACGAVLQINFIPKRRRKVKEF